MGLSGRRVKQRIGKDPRNLSWVDDASRFGQAYLEKFGWDASKGLGASGEGRTSAIKATQKLDMLGIGMRHQKDAEGGIAWRQNRDFEDLLRRLNEGTTTENTDSTGLLDSFHTAREPNSESLEGGDGVENLKVLKDGSGGSELEEERKGVMTKKEKKKKKKKRKATAECEEELEEEEGRDRTVRKKKRKRSSSKDGGDDDDGRAQVPSSSSIESELPSSLSRPPPRREAPHAEESGSVPKITATATTVTAPVPVRAPPRTHRARIIASKRMAASNSTALAEILGIPSSSSSSLRPSAVASPVPIISDPAPVVVPPPTTTTITTTTTEEKEKESLQILTTSSQSVGDYFRAKLSAKEAQGERTLAAVGGAATPASVRDEEDNRSGLVFGGKTSRVTPPDHLDEEPVRRGIGASSSTSRFATMFMQAQDQPTTKAQNENTMTASVEPVVTHDASDHDDNQKKSEKKRAKEERRREKEERRRRRAEAERVDRVAVDVPKDSDVASAAGSKKKCREPEDSHPSGADGREAIATKKRKKDKKASKHRGPEE